MKMLLLVFSIVAVLLTSCVSMESGLKNDPITALKQLDQERIQAQIGADAAALDRLYAEDFIGIGPSGTVRAKAQVIADFTSGNLRFQSITTDEVQWRVYGDTAVETGRSTMNGQDKGKTVPRDNRFTRVWVKRLGRWQLVANHYSLLVAQQWGGLVPNRAWRLTIRSSERAQAPAEARFARRSWWGTPLNSGSVSRCEMLVDKRQSNGMPNSE